MTPHLTILSAEPDRVLVLIDGNPYRITIREASRALALLDEGLTCETTVRVGTRGPRLNRDQWLAMADAMRTAELGGGA